MSTAGRSWTTQPHRWFVAASWVILASGTSAAVHSIEGRVVGVSDGDTITLLDIDHRQHKIRLHGIDAPEMGQPFGRASRQHLARQLADREATAECHKKDRYGRDVCRVLVAGVDAGLAQIQAGMAWYFRRYAHEQPDLRQQYADTEGQARASRSGLWADVAPTPPWDWRRTSRPERHPP